MLVEKGIEICVHLLEISKLNASLQFTLETAVSNKHKAVWLLIHHFNTVIKQDVKKGKSLFRELDTTYTLICEKIFKEYFDGGKEQQVEVIHGITDAQDYDFPVGGQNIKKRIMRQMFKFDEDTRRLTLFKHERTFSPEDG